MSIFDEMESEYTTAVLDRLSCEIKEKFLDKALECETTELKYGSYTLRYVPFIARDKYDSGISVTKDNEVETDLNDMELSELEALLNEVSR